MRIYRAFWSKALGVSTADLKRRTNQTSTCGAYVERHGTKFTFLFQDLTLKKKISVHHPDARKRSGKIKFDDIDYGLLKKSSLNDVALSSPTVKIRKLSAKDKRAVAAFRKKCSTRHWDTLDLNLPGDTAYALVSHKTILGIARAAKMRTVPHLADITVVLAPAARGKGLSTPLVSKLLRNMMTKGWFPKYRVARKNLASRAIAERLGLTPLYSLKTFY